MAGVSREQEERQDKYRLPERQVLASPRRAESDCEQRNNDLVEIIV